MVKRPVSGKNDKKSALFLRLVEFDETFRRKGYGCIAGVDEAGRGPLAGPVVAAAVVMPEGIVVEGIADSKSLPAGDRELIFSEMMRKRLPVGIACIPPHVIDRLNILRATHLAMARAVLNLPVKPNLILVDGPHPIPDLPIPSRAVVKGDSKSLAIAAASIVAKVFRDRIMKRYDALYPEYGFGRHKGYPTREHLAAIERFGPCPIHRLSFGGLRRCNEEGRGRRRKPLQLTFFGNRDVPSSSVM
ncbi:ribonuclease HII [Thermodesulforhabdus norvegica]|uniref:Ribonuclease HII n=1 Tax=Thermodesulforhabdus norvegica TaxID=39841 RepID=A0A1I4QZK8_9BACT|nr:ribonuclease HII [Thermodesulforhabdus norvegica]SFM45140.1 RNase HII [Thermodesulforhabdus norvegica]